MGKNLIADGHTVRCWNRTPKADFPNFYASIEEAVDQAEVIFIVVYDPAAVQFVSVPTLPFVASPESPSSFWSAFV